MQLGSRNVRNVGISLPYHTLSSHRMPRRHTLCAAAPKRKIETEEYLTPFLRSEITETLTGVEHVPEPLWASWCGHASGVWVGSAAAYAPTTGLPEPIALGEDGKTKLYAMQQCCVEEREANGDEDLMVRRTARATSTTQLEREMAAGDALNFDSTASLDWEVEELAQGQQGLFIFDGGSYSVGPVQLCDGDEAAVMSGSGVVLDTDALFVDRSVPQGLSDEAWQQYVSDHESEEEEESDEEEEESDVLDIIDDDGDYFDELDGEEGGDEYYVTEEAPPPPGCTTVIEHCLQWGGERRVRIRLTLSSILSPAEEPAVVATSKGTSKNGSNGNGNVPNSESASEVDGELDVNLLRVSVSREDWEGAPGRYTASTQGSAARASQEKSAFTRLRPADVAGFWNVFEVVAKTAADVDMRTGAPAIIPVYNSREVQQLVQMPAAAFEESDGGIGGGTLWLPHSVAVQLTQGGSSSGLQVVTWWRPEKGVLLSLTRKYSRTGELIEAITSTAIRAD